jgi:hypothetical protein
MPGIGADLFARGMKNVSVITSSAEMGSARRSGNPKIPTLYGLVTTTECPGWSFRSVSAAQTSVPARFAEADAGNV